VITVISGSDRTGSASAKVAEHVAGLLRERSSTTCVEVLDLSQSVLPLWQEGIEHLGPAVLGDWVSCSRLLDGSDGFVVVVPEWGGMAPPALKNLFLLCDRTWQLADKPALLIGVSSGPGGAYPVAELRMSSYKNTRICYIPEQVIIRDVEDLFDGVTLVRSPEAQRLNRQLLHAVDLLLQYADALVKVRMSGVRDHDEFRWNA
jgi:NAD(P)H-dependent FMN reductase